MLDNNLKIAVIGAGRWGVNHVKTATLLVPKSHIWVCDKSKETEKRIKEISEEINFTNRLSDILNNLEINCIIVATPAETHYKIAKECILQNKNVLVEKPITLFLDEAEELEKLASKKNVKLMVGHVLLYHPAILAIKKGLNEGILGKLQYIYSNRLNLGAIRKEENILWSFAPHDISIIQFLIEDYPLSIFAKGDTFLQKNIEDTTLTYLQYPKNISAHVFVSWLHPFKEQRLVVIGEKGMFVFEDTVKDEKLRFYKKGFKKTDLGIEKFDQNYDVVSLESVMPLEEEQKHFYNSVINDTEPRTNGKHAVDVLKILVKATESLKANKIV
ncbi:MAG: Gfo/Idh/MocA family oxidoreductase [bacterium]